MPFASAADWSDTSLSVRYGTPLRRALRRQRRWLPRRHQEDDRGPDPRRWLQVRQQLLQRRRVALRQQGTRATATRATRVRRRSISSTGTPSTSGKVTGQKLSYGLMRGVGLTGGFDVNSKNDSYGSKKRMLVIGPTIMLDVPGFLNLSALLLDESNSPNGLPDRLPLQEPRRPRGRLPASASVRCRWPSRAMSSTSAPRG